jgi:L-fuconolactonase
MSTVIDSHHHFWKYSPAEYQWIGPGKEVLRRDFLPRDLQEKTAAAGVQGVISVQARQSIGETNWLLDLAERHDFIRGVVGWAPLIDADLRRHLDGWDGRPKLLGLRHVLQDEPDDRYMLRADFNAGISVLREYGLAYDILIFERQLPAAIELVDRHPQQIFILDHIAKAKIVEGELEPWRTRVRELAKRRNVYCKVSGMATEANWQTWTADELRPYFETVLDAFSPRRLMFGSDWPVCLLACDYIRWVQTVQKWIESLSTFERQRIWAESAIEAYGLSAQVYSEKSPELRHPL